MKVELPKGKYILAVSGGVDSMALLHLLAQKATVNSQQSTVNSSKSKSRHYRLSTNDSSSLELVVAHFDHGIRPDSAEDTALVSQTASKLGLAFETAKGKLGSKASEATARTARYKFLEQIRQKYDAKSVVTAHHQDDIVESALINLLRGTNWRGMASVQNRGYLLRPMSKINKRQIVSYAKTHKLEWREDETNRQDQYLRNYLRNQVLPKMTTLDREKLISNIDEVANKRTEFEHIIATISHSILKNSHIDRRKFSSLPLPIERELVAYWLRQQEVNYSSRLITQLCLEIKNSSSNTTHDINSGLKLQIGPRLATFVRLS